MFTLSSSGERIRQRVLSHLLERLDAVRALDAPFSHMYVEEVFPHDLYAQMRQLLPPPELYTRASQRHREEGEGQYVRTFFNLDRLQLPQLSPQQQDLWGGIAAALTAPEVKEAVFAKLAKDLTFRFGVPPAQTPRLAAYARPTLYREVEGFEIAPHPDTRKKIVTMHLYLPADRSQLDLGTALYRKKILAWPFGSWRHRFVKVKQFPFQPNSGYAFVVNNSLTKKSWHGREKLPPGSGVRDSLLTTFYETAREEFVFEQTRRAA